MTEILQHPITEALGWTLLHSLWQLTLLALLFRILLGIPALRRAQLRYLLGMGALILSALIPFFTFTLVYEPPLVAELAQNTAELAVPVQNMGKGQFQDLLIIQGSTSPEPSIEPTSWKTRIKGIMGIFKPFLSPLALTWLLGIGLMTLRFIGGWFQLQQLRKTGLEAIPTHWDSRFQEWEEKMGIRRRVGFFISQNVSEPLTLGHFKPLVLIPIGLLTQQSPDQVEAIILHELAHIRRYDFTFNLIQSFVEIVFFYHPAIWWLSKDVRETREHCCDDLAISVSQNPLAYAQALTQLQLNTLTHSKQQLAMPVSGNTSKFSQRIYRIMGQPTQQFTPTRGVLLAVLTFVATFLFAFQQQQYAEEELLLESILEDSRVDTTHLQNWLLFTIHPNTSQKKLNNWLEEVNQLSGNPFQLEVNSNLNKIQNLTAFKMKAGEKSRLWELSHEENGLEKVMMVYDPILDRLYIQMGLENGLWTYDLATDAIIIEDSLPFGTKSDSTILPMIEFSEAELASLPEEFTIEFTPESTMDDLLKWNLACAKLGIKLEYDQVVFDSGNGKLIKLEGTYQHYGEKVRPFSYENFYKVLFKVDKPKGAIPSTVFMGVPEEMKLDLPNQQATYEFLISPSLTSSELDEINERLRAFQIRLFVDHTERLNNGDIQDIYGHFQYPGYKARFFSVEHLKSIEIYLDETQEDPVSLVISTTGKGGMHLQENTPSPFKQLESPGSVYEYDNTFAILRGPEVFKTYKKPSVFFSYSQEKLVAKIEEVLGNFPPNGILTVNGDPMSPQTFLERNIPIQAYTGLTHWDAPAAKAEFETNYTGPLYQLTYRITQGAEKAPPLLVVDGDIRGNTEIQNLKTYTGLQTQDIKSINVLKGSAAIKTYGEAGKNGVIEVFTKLEPFVELVGDPSESVIDLASPLRFRIHAADPKEINLKWIPLKGTNDYKLILSYEKRAKEFVFSLATPLSEGTANLQYKIMDKATAEQEMGLSGKSGLLEAWILPPKTPLKEVGQSLVNGVVITDEGAIPDANSPHTSPEPLMVIDGEVYKQKHIFGKGKSLGLDPKEIESIHVLKGEAAKKKYGEKGGNGVVEISLKPNPIRLKISDFVIPNGMGRATTYPSSTYDDVLIIKDLKKGRVLLNGIEMLYNPITKKHVFDQVAQQRILGYASIDRGERQYKSFYTDQAPEVLWRTDVFGLSPTEKKANITLFMLNTDQPEKLNVRVKLNGFKSSETQRMYTIEVNDQAENILSEGVILMQKEQDVVSPKIRILTEKEAVKEFGTSGVTGLLVVELEPSGQKTYSEQTLPSTPSEFFDERVQVPFTNPTERFPLVALSVAPNPVVDGNVNISFAIEKKRAVRLSLFDRAGKEVAVIVDQAFDTGTHNRVWDTQELASGLYLLVAKVGEEGRSVPLVVK